MVSRYHSDGQFIFLDLAVQESIVSHLDPNRANSQTTKDFLLENFDALQSAAKYLKVEKQQVLRTTTV